MFDKVKLALRLKSAAFDDEVRLLIAAAVDDLRSLGICVPDCLLPPENVTETITKEELDELEAPPDLLDPAAFIPRVERAIVLYCKGHFGYLNANDAERFLKAYNLQKSALHFERGRGVAVE